MTEIHNKKDLLTANQFVKKHGLDKKEDLENVKLAMEKLRGLTMDPPKDSHRRAKVPVIVVTGKKNGNPKVNFGADEIVLAKVASLKSQGK